MNKYLTHLQLILFGGAICLAAAGCVQPQLLQLAQGEASDSLFDLLDDELLLGQPSQANGVQPPAPSPAELPEVSGQEDAVTTDALAPEPRVPPEPAVEPGALGGLQDLVGNRGVEAFNSNCTQCHEADDALTVKKSYDAWMETIDEMVEYAEEDGLEINMSDIRPIASYLANRTDEEIAQAKVVAARKAEEKAQEEAKQANAEPDDGSGPDDGREKPDFAAELEKGKTAFNASCLDCHDAARSLTVDKSFADWMSTIRRMAKKKDANIDSDDFGRIAWYLSSRTTAEIEAAKREDQQAEDEAAKDSDKADETKSQAELITQGESAFYASCVKCHDAERSLSVQKSQDEWMSTIRRMAEKEDAEIASRDFRAIATFLAERTDSEVAESKAKAKESADEQEDEDASGEADAGRKFDPALVSAGRTAFYKSCVKCHDAQRSLSKKKSLASWRATVKRMAAKDGADVRPSDVEAISVFLAAESAGGEGAVEDGGGEVSPWTFSSTLSTLHRVSSDPIENPGFFVDAWVGADWQSDGPLRATVIACTSCHSDRNSSKGFTFELVEASATLDMKKLLFERHHSETTKQAARAATQTNARMNNAHGTMLQLNAPENATQHSMMAPSVSTSSESPISTSADLKMGRFVVPFGAFASFSHPGSYRTVSNPLMFNMGRRLDTGGPFQPVLPAPYSDEGLNLRFGLREYCDRSYTLDLFVVNGLQGTAGGTNFNLSRSYTDNNRRPAVGGRYTLGNQIFRLGASGMIGQLQNDASPEFAYHLLGADAVVTTELVRAYFEYAFRQEETGMGDNSIDGYIIEIEWKLLERLGFLTRYDTLEHELGAGNGQSIDRFTWGLNLGFERAGLLLLNHEHWMLDDRSDVDVVGLRWITTF